MSIFGYEIFQPTRLFSTYTFINFRKNVPPIFDEKYRYLGPEWLQSIKTQTDLGQEIPSAPAQPCAPAQNNQNIPFNPM